MTNDNRVARDEDQVAGERGDMSPKGGKGPTAASAADTEGAFGDTQASAHEQVSAEDALTKGLQGVGGELPETRP